MLRYRVLLSIRLLLFLHSANDATPSIDVVFPGAHDNIAVVNDDEAAIDVAMGDSIDNNNDRVDFWSDNEEEPTTCTTNVNSGFLQGPAVDCEVEAETKMSF